MPDYSLGKIYRIYSPSNPDAGEYIGSSCEKLLCRRMAKHRCQYKRYMEKGVGIKTTSFPILEYPDAKIELVESFPCETKDELLKREGSWIERKRLEGGCVNRKVAGQSQAEYMEKHREQEAERARKWYAENKERAVETKKQYYEKNKEEIIKKQLEYQREYRKKNREMIRRKEREYYAKNKDKINERKRERKNKNK